MVDRDERAFRKLDAAYGGLTLVGDATDVAVLRSAQIERADTVVSVTNDDNTNIMVIFGVFSNVIESHRIYSWN